MKMTINNRVFITGNVIVLDLVKGIHSFVLSATLLARPD